MLEAGPVLEELRERGLVGRDAVLALCAPLSTRFSVREVREITIAPNRRSRSQRNPWLGDDTPPSWDEVELELVPATFTELSRFLETFLSFAAADRSVVFDWFLGQLEAHLGSHAQWAIRVAKAAPLAHAYCCGYQSFIVTANDRSLLLSLGMYCG